MEKKLELKRQLFHMGMGVAIVILFSLNILTVKSLFVIFFAGFVISLLSKKHKIPLIYWFLKNFERKEDLKKNPGIGPFFYIAGTLVSFLIFEKNIALASVMILAFGDSVCTIVGKFTGKIKHVFNPKKCLEGTVFGIFCASLAASLFVSTASAFLGSTVAMLFEAFELRIGKTLIDDNLTIPFISALTIYLFQTL